MKKLFPVLLAALCLTTVCATAASAAFTTKDTTAYKAAAAPVIDGVYNASEGWGDPIVHIVNPTAPEYLSLCAADHPELLTDPDLIPSEATVYFRWDDTNFYYCCTAVQEKRSCAYDWGTSGDIWKGDSIVFNFKSTDETESYSRAAVALTDTDGIVYAEYAIEDGTLGFSEYDHWKVTRDENTKTTTYEMSFKWENVIPDEAVAVGDIVYLRDLLMPATSVDIANPVDFNTAGLAADGSYNYWKITLAEEGAATAAPAAAAEFTTYAECPDMPGTELVYATGDMDMLSGYDAKGGIGVDLFNLASGGTSYCLKRDTSAWYDFEVAEKTDVTFYVGYIARDGSNRGLDYAIDGGARVFMDLPESAEQQWVSATFTVDAGKHSFYLYAPTGMDDSTLKSCDIYTIELYGTPAAGAAASEAPAASAAASSEPTILWDFNSDEAMSDVMSGANAVSYFGDTIDGVECFEFLASGNDPYVSVNMSADSVDDVVWAKARVKNPSYATAIELFGATNGRSLAGSECTHIDVKSEDEGWYTYLIYIPDENVKTVNAYKDPQYAITEPYWAGTVEYIRLDPLWREGDDGSDAGGNMAGGESIYIDYIAFFPTKEAALAFRTADDNYAFPEQGPAPAAEEPAPAPAVEETPVVEEVPAVEETPVVEEAPVAEEVVEAPAEEVVEEEAVEAPAVEETVEEAPQTFDFGVIAAVAALVSAAGYALSKKR